MATPRKKTPDVLGEVLTPALKYQHDSTPADRLNSTPARQGDGIQVRQYTSTPAQEKTKATFYVSPAILEALEDAWIRLRRLAPPADRGKVSKSLVVELALALTLEELEAAGADSPLARRLVSQHDRTP